MPLEKIAVTTVKDVKRLIKEYSHQLNLIQVKHLAAAIKKEKPLDEVLSGICDDLREMVADMREYALMRDPSDPQPDSGPFKVVIREHYGQAIAGIVHVSTVQEAKDMKVLLSRFDLDIESSCLQG
jgi:hypothetical protein